MLAQALFLLLPATLAIAFIVFISYPAYPPSCLSAAQLAFDLGMLLMLAGIAAAWRLAVLHLMGGGIGNTHRAWLAAVALGALVGTAGAATAVVHLLDPQDPGVWVGYALLAPGVLLVPPALQLAMLYLRRAR